MSYSQNDEEAVIMKHLAGKSGKFIDIGAYDVFRFSNTRALYETGRWKGVFVEPAPQNYKAIADHYASDPEIKVLNVAVGETNGEIDFYESDGDAVGTSDVQHMEKWGAAGVKYTPIKVQQVSVVDFMNEHAKDADFISIDTEATNMQVFRNTPDWVFEQIQLFCIEHDGLHEEVENRLVPFGFNTLYLNAENIIMGRTR